MQHGRRPARPTAEALSEPAAARLLARASELDAARSADTAVAELRAAAAEAGISAAAFDTALGELYGAEQAGVADTSKRRRRRARRWAVGASVATLIVAGAMAVIEARAPAGAAMPMVEEAFVLRCLSSAEAAEVIRPFLDRHTTVEYSPARAPRVLTIRATPVQMEKVRSVLNQHEGAGSPTCTP